MARRDREGASAPPAGRGASATLPAAAGLWAVVLAGLLSALLLLPLPAHGVGIVGGGSFATTSGSGCNPSNSAPSSLYISLANPSGSVLAKGTVTVTLEVAALNSTPAPNGTLIYVPTAATTFPLQSSGSLSVSMPPKTLTLSGAGWAAAASESKSKTVSSATSFAKSSNAYLSTSRIAVMASADYGSLELEFRWNWSVQSSPLGTTTSSGWSVPSLVATSPNRPSIFEPAPYVAIASTSPQPAASGSNFSVDLTGAVANTSFRIVVEYPKNGTEITSTWEYTPVAATQFNATAPLTYPNSTPLPAGSYLLHVHDRCGAILHSVSLTVTGAPTRLLVSGRSVPSGTPPGSYGGDPNGGRVP
ncbi:MAG: hypothetical protein L3J91_03655 [Thermoplasmata archaeon]|nr:hypothetical protein [Thermoplasmata archaeon]